MTLEFLVTTLIVVASPGTGVVYTLAVGLGQGPRAAVAAALGCTLGVAPHLAATLVGLSAVLHASAVAFSVLKYAGVAYLLFMAWRSLQAAGPLAIAGDAPRRSAAVIVRDGVLLNLFNPKLTIFFVAFLPQFISAEEAHPMRRAMDLSGAFMAATFIVFAVYGALAGVLRQRVLARPMVMAWLRRGFAGAFGLLAGRLAFTER